MILDSHDDFRWQQLFVKKGCQHLNGIQMLTVTRERTKCYSSDINPSLLLGENPRLIEKWQLSSKLWDAIRFEIDHRREDGIYIVPIGSLKN